MIECLALGPGRGELSDSWAIFGGVLFLAASLIFLRQWNTAPENRGRWGRYGGGPPMSRVGLAAWIVCTSTWSVVLLTKPLKLIPHKVGFYCIMAATLGLFAGAVYDGWVNAKPRQS